MKAAHKTSCLSVPERSGFSQCTDSVLKNDIFRPTSNNCRLASAPPTDKKYLIWKKSKFNELFFGFLRKYIFIDNVMATNGKPNWGNLLLFLRIVILKN